MIRLDGAVSTGASQEELYASNTHLRAISLITTIQSQYSSHPPLSSVVIISAQHDCVMSKGY